MATSLKDQTLPPYHHAHFLFFIQKSFMINPIPSHIPNPLESYFNQNRYSPSDLITIN